MKALLIILFLRSILARNEFGSFVTQYFKEREVKSICLLDCDLEFLNKQSFAKASFKNSMDISNVKINGNLNEFSKIYQCLGIKSTSVGVVVDPQCVRFGEILDYASQNMLLDSRHKWLIISEKDTCNTTNINETEISPFDFQNVGTKMGNIVDVLNNLNISVDADICIALPDGQFYEVYEVYNFGKIQGGNITIMRLGIWDSNDSKIISHPGYKYYRRWDFQEIHMRMIVVSSITPKEFKPEMLYSMNPTPGVAVITKVASMILDVIAERHNFSFKYTVTDRWVGELYKNSSRVVINSLYFREQDISAVIRLLKPVVDHIDFIHPPLTSIETKFYYRIPSAGAGNLENQFLRPLTTGAWICVAVVILFCAIVLFFSAKLERRPASIQYAFFSVFASICQQSFQDVEIKLRRVSSARQVVMIVTGFSCLLIYNYYTSSVVSWLLNGPPPSINTLDELLESPLNLIFEDIGYTRSWLQSKYYYFNKKNSGIEDKLKKFKVYNKKKGEPLLMTVEEGIDMVISGGYAFHTEVTSASNQISSKFTQSELCELGSLSSMEKTSLYPPIQKNSPYKEFFVWSLMRLSERGIISCIRRRLSSFSVKCEGSSPRALALGGAAPAFILLAAGYVAAVCVLILEILCKRHAMFIKMKLNYYFGSYTP